MVLFDACRNQLDFAVEPVWLDHPAASPNSNQVKVFSAFASKNGKAAKEVEFANGKWAGVLTQAFLTGVKGYAADEHGVVYADALRKFLFAAVKQQLGVAFEPDVDDGCDPNDPPWPLFQAARKLPRVVIDPVHTKQGMATFRQIRSGDSVPIDLSAGPQVREVPYGYYSLTLPDQTEKKIIAAWEETVVEV